MRNCIYRKTWTHSALKRAVVAWMNAMGDEEIDEEAVSAHFGIGLEDAANVLDSLHRSGRIVCDESECKWCDS